MPNDNNLNTLMTLGFLSVFSPRIWPGLFNEIILYNNETESV